MGMKLKSGADLCGFELSRFCVQNDVAIPDAPASGRKYFHTGTGTEGKYSLLGRERIFTGTSWRAAAYVDDLANLDLATNEDYLKLKEKVDLLSGEVDTDAIISNMKEVTAFLSGFAEDANLMSVLDGKLDKTGGEIISEAFGALTINRNLPYASGIKFSNSDGVLGYIGINNDYTPMVWDKDGANAHTLLHSGNVGDYALKTDGSNAMKDVMTLEYANPRIAFKSDANTTLGSIGFYNGVPSAYLFSANAWKTIAFTDSDITGNAATANKLITSSGADAIVPTTSGYSLVYGDLWVWAQDASDRFVRLRNSMSDLYTRLKTDGSGEIFVSGSHALKLGTANTTRMLINSSGNVTIGGEDYAKNSSKLFVNGNTRISIGNRTHLLVDNAFASYDETLGGFFLYGGIREGEALSCEIAGVGGSWVRAGYKLLQNGYFGIGVNPEHKLHVGGDIVANGTIACKGIAAEGTEVGMGTVDKKVLSIPSSTTQQTFSLTHGLNTREITVCIYEVTSTGTNMILTDVEITGDNTISVSFGNPPSENHMVVVMG